jgi:hypothetical protein
MEELDKVLQALDVVERYEEYLFRKVWGKALIVIGIVLPLGVLISMNATLLGATLGLDAGILSLLANVFALILCCGFIGYSFFESWKTVDHRQEGEKSDSKHGPIIGLVWFLAFVSTSIAPESLQLVSLLWAASISCLLSFLILRAVGSHGQVQILLILGLFLGLISFPLLLITDLVLLGYMAMIVFSVGFVLSGIMMNRFAAKMLQQQA